MDHDHTAPTLKRPSERLDYALNQENTDRAIELGLAEADWYQCPVPRETMRRLLVRKDGPAIRDTLIWFGLIFGTAFLTASLWGTWWALLPYTIYAALYASTSDSRWHESSHGTAFRTDWMNNALYEVASFMVMRESTVWRWSHNRHHSDTIIVGRDPEIAVPRPPDINGLIKATFGLPTYPKYFRRLLKHSFGTMVEDEQQFIPESEFPKVFLRARCHLFVYLTTIALAIGTGSILPLMFVGLPHIFGTWLMLVYGLTQHTGLAENVLDHRLNCRTVLMNPVNRFLYWNMNYHVEHHMFPLVPYHALPELHEVVKGDCPKPYPNLLATWREIIPTILKQVNDPAHHVKRQLPERQAPPESHARVSDAEPNAEGWLEICAASDLEWEDVIRFDHGTRTYALTRDDEGGLHATDGLCTHGNTHLADGLVKGKIIECPKHNGRFYLKDGSPSRAPICRGLATYPIEEREGRIWLNMKKAGGAGARGEQAIEFKVVGTRNVATFIRELVLEPVDEMVSFQPGDYIQLDIPSYEKIRFRDFEIAPPYAEVWERQHLFDLVASNPGSPRRNNYSLANNCTTERQLRFNVRIATPPPGQDCPPGVGSSYLYSLKLGDQVTAIGPFGDFHIRNTKREMVYIGGGAGMAPLRAHLAHLFENEQTPRKVSYWYGARSRQEIFYEKYFDVLAAKHHNFSFQVALSNPQPEDKWGGAIGFIHEVVHKEYLRKHRNPKAIEFYLCGPPMMIKACTKMLVDLGVERPQISYDEF